MPKTTLTIHIEVGTPKPIDGLCPECWKPALIRVPFAMFSEMGVNSFAYTGCTDCHREVEPV